MQEVDDGFYDRADAHINLYNDQLSEKVGRGKVSASMMYSTARFNTWVSACGWPGARDLAEAKEETIEYFVSEYQKMLDHFWFALYILNIAQSGRLNSHFSRTFR